MSAQSRHLPQLSEHRWMMPASQTSCLQPSPAPAASCPTAAAARSADRCIDLLPIRSSSQQLRWRGRLQKLAIRELCGIMECSCERSGLRSSSVCWVRTAQLYVVCQNKPISPWLVETCRLHLPCFLARIGGANVPSSAVVLCPCSLLLGLALPDVQPRAKAGTVWLVTAGRQGVRQRHEDCRVACADSAAVLCLHHIP